MEYKEEIYKKKRIIYVKTKGYLSKEELGPLTTLTRLKAKKLNCSLLFDFRESINNISIFEAYYWIKEFYDKIDKSLKYIPTVHIVNKDNEEFFNFVETAWSNRGCCVHNFRDKKEGLHWLEENQVNEK